MKMSPESGPSTPEKKIEDVEKVVPAIKFAETLSKKDFNKLKEVGWVEGPIGSDGSIHLLWIEDGEDPKLPDDLEKDDIDIERRTIGV